MDIETVLKNVGEVSSRFSSQRTERQRRTALAEADFSTLRDAGFLLTGVPVEQGGVWENLRRSARPVCEILRILAHGDPSVALVSAMHPSVLAVWLASPTVPTPYRDLWTSQRRYVFETARAGAWWGTITSEPGSGGDLTRTKATAHPRSDGTYLVAGQKQFGSGSGITSYVITTALPDGEITPDLFFIDMRGVPWDGSRGVALAAPWDGQGMRATQSHAMSFTGVPATRSAWPGGVLDLMAATGGFIPSAFTSVIVGVVETTVETAREHVIRRRDSLRSYERVEWAKAEMDGWVIQQIYEGMLRAVESGHEGPRRATQAKMAIAELAESVTSRICRVVGGGTFSRSSPFGFWHEDVRALGFLRPPWGLAYDNLFDWSSAVSE